MKPIIQQIKQNPLAFSMSPLGRLFTAAYRMVPSTYDTMDYKYKKSDEPIRIVFSGMGDSKHTDYAKKRFQQAYAGKPVYVFGHPQLQQALDFSQQIPRDVPVQVFGYSWGSPTAMKFIDQYNGNIVGAHYIDPMRHAVVDDKVISNKKHIPTTYMTAGQYQNQPLKNALLNALRMSPAQEMETLMSIKDHAALQQALQYIKQKKHSKAQSFAQALTEANLQKSAKLDIHTSYTGRNNFTPGTRGRGTRKQQLLPVYQMSDQQRAAHRAAGMRRDSARLKQKYNTAERGRKAQLQRKGQYYGPDAMDDATYNKIKSDTEASRYVRLNDARQKFQRQTQQYNKAKNLATKEGREFTREAPNARQILLETMNRGRAPNKDPNYRYYMGPQKRSQQWIDNQRNSIRQNAKQQGINGAKRLDDYYTEINAAKKYPTMYKDYLRRRPQLPGYIEQQQAKKGLSAFDKSLEKTKGVYYPTDDLEKENPGYTSTDRLMYKTNPYSSKEYNDSVMKSRQELDAWQQSIMGPRKQSKPTRAPVPSANQNRPVQRPVAAPVRPVAPTNPQQAQAVRSNVQRPVPSVPKAPVQQRPVQQAPRPLGQPNVQLMRPVQPSVPKQQAVQPRPQTQIQPNRPVVGTTPNYGVPTPNINMQSRNPNIRN